MEQTINGIPVGSLADCGCECGGLARSPKATFIPGHDAKMVSKLAKRMYVAYRDGDEVAIFGIWQKTKGFSPALQGKLHGAFSLAKTRAQRVASKKQESSGESWNPGHAGHVKVGRWLYPARINDKGLTFRNTKRDGSGEWVRHQEAQVA